MPPPNQIRRAGIFLVGFSVERGPHGSGDGGSDGRLRRRPDGLRHVQSSVQGHCHLRGAPHCMLRLQFLAPILRTGSWGENIPAACTSHGRGERIYPYRAPIADGERGFLLVS
eukprot:271702-Prorocentrum_minimum.AAC.3